MMDSLRIRNIINELLVLNIVVEKQFLSETIKELIFGQKWSKCWYLIFHTSQRHR